MGVGRKRGVGGGGVVGGGGRRRRRRRRRRDMGADLRFGFLRLSTIKKCPHMLRSDHRELR